MTMEGYGGTSQSGNEAPKFKVFETDLESKPKPGQQQKIEQRVLSEFKPPEAGPGRSGNEEALKAARINIAENEKLISNFIRGLQDAEGRDVTRLARVQNHLVKHCVNLTDDEIDSVMRHFMIAANAWFLKHRDEFLLQGDSTHMLKITDNRIVNAKGVKSMVHYLRERSKQLSAEAGSHMIAFDEYLDSHYKVDAIEMTYSEDEGSELSIDEMNLVQVKNAVPTEDDVLSIQSDHRAWALGRMLSFEELRERKLESNDPNGSAEKYKEKAEIQEALIDIMMSEEQFDEGSLLAKLGLKDAPNARRLLVLLENARLFTETLEDLAREGYADIEWSERFRSVYNSLVAAAAAKVGFPLKAAPVRSINSVIVAGGKVIKKTNIYTRSNDDDFGKFVSYS